MEGPSKAGGGGRGRGRGRSAPVDEPSEEGPVKEEVTSSAELASRLQELSAQYVEPTDEPSSSVPSRVRGRGDNDPLLLVTPRRPDDSFRGRARGRGYRSSEEPRMVEKGVAGVVEMGKDMYGGTIEGLESPPGGEKSAESPASPVSPVEDEHSRSPDKEEAEVAADARSVGVGGGQGSLLEAGVIKSLSLDTPSQSKKVDEPPVIVRRGAKGQFINSTSNYLRLTFKAGHDGMAEYHVTFNCEPAVENVKARRQIMQQFEAQIGRVRSFDGMILFLPKILEHDVTVLHGMQPNGSPVSVIITFVKIRSMADAVTFYNILLNRVMLELGYIELRRSFYDINKARLLAQHKLEIWPGTNLTTENQEDGLMICVDNSSRVLRTDTVYHYYRDLKASGEKNYREKFNNFIINKIIITKYNNACYKIDDVAWDMTPASEFDFKTKRMSFTEYLKGQYNIDVTDQEQPMLISKLKPRKNERVAATQEQRLAALVPEFCFITGLTDEQRANFKVMTDLATTTRLQPQQRVVQLNEFIAALLKNERASEILGGWGLQIEPHLIPVTGRRMDGPELSFSTRLTVKRCGPDFGRESGQGVYEPIEIKKYVVICTQRDSDKAKRFIETYRQVCGPLGIKMLQLGMIIPVKGMQPNDFRSALLQHGDPNDLQFVIIIMPQQRDDVYSAIKKYCVSDKPLPSQCILTKTLSNEKRLRSIVLKIALQINCKIGGSLWALRMPLKEEIMFVGIDAAHDPMKKDASVICLVASLNNQCTKYFSRSTTSKVHQELVDSLRSMMAEALDSYRKVRSKYPDRVVVFRDGGSVGALQQIETTEMNQIKVAIEECKMKDCLYTFCVVAKRIPQRFMHMKEGGGRNQEYINPEPGSVYDNTVTRRHHYDFYLVSQQVRQGTVNPTHFLILDPEDPIKPDLIQKLSYVTTFMYYNWAGTVRVPAMVQYAHKLAALLSRHVKAPPHATITNTLYYL